MATIPNLIYDIKLEIRNEITGQPHIHYYTKDWCAAQAFGYSAKEIFGITPTATVYSDFSEGDIIPCTPCREATARLEQDLYRARAMSKVWP